ncbi:hypothetical protein WJX82_006558 [Trebouxia sp. C0006]
MAGAFVRDCDVGGVGLVMHFESIDWFPVDHKATATGWEAGLALYKESHRLQQTQDAHERRCAELLGRVCETNVKGTTAADPAADPGAELIYILNNFHIPLFGQFVTAQSALPAFRDKTEALGIHCQDIEWFSRHAMLKFTLQMCTKQGFMPADVLSEATRHAERLVELAPGNPASHELRSYVHMHNTEQDLDIACGSMKAAMQIAEAAKDDVGVLLYAQQVMYFMLWKFNSTPSKTREALSLEKSLSGVLHTVKESEEHIREARASESVCDVVQSMASSRLTAAKCRNNRSSTATPAAQHPGTPLVLQRDRCCQL